MNVKQELQKIEGIKNIVCRGNGVLEVYFIGDVKNEVLKFLNMKCLSDCFISVDFHNMEDWRK